MRPRLPSLRRRATGETLAEAAPAPPTDQPVAWPPEEPTPGTEPPAEPATTVMPEAGGADTTVPPAVPESATTAFPPASAVPDAPGPDAQRPDAREEAIVLPPPDPSRPAGTEPGPPTASPEPSFRSRGRLRRRLRYLRRVRELGLRDLGGLLFDLHRFGRDGEVLLAGKLSALKSVDDEVRALEEALEDRRELVVLREPGIAACPRCAALHGSDANFCPNCGLAFSGAHRFAAEAPLPPPSVVPGPDAVTAAHPRVGEQDRPLG